MNEPYRLRYTNQIVGVFLLILLVIITVLGVAVTRVSRILVQPDHFFVDLAEQEVIDLRSGAEVTVLGKRIGQVESLDYLGGGDQVRVTLAIDPSYRSNITTDSELCLERKFGLGTLYVNIRRKAGVNRQAPGVPLEPGAVIASFRGEIDRVEQMADQVQGAGESIDKIEKKLNPTLNSIDVAANRFRGSLDNSVDPAFSQGRSAFQSVEQTSETLRADTAQTLESIRMATAKLERELSDLANQVQGVVEKDVTATLLSIKNSSDAASNAALSVAMTSSNLDKKTDKTNQEITATLAVMRDSLIQIQKLTNDTRELVRILRGEAEELPGTTERVNQTVGETQDLVRQLRSHWLLRRTNSDPNMSQQVSPSSIRTGGAR